MTTSRPLPLGSVVGILGGGQLGRMLALAAAEMGLRVHIYAPPGDNPATDVSHAATIAAWDDEAALGAFASAVDVVTYEFENIPLESVAFVDERVRVRPGMAALATAQDRLAEKTMAAELGLGVAPFAAVDDAAGLAIAVGAIPLPAILKTRRFGYDGKGQARIDRPSDADAAWKAIGAAPSILEQRVPFQTEISVLLARGADGTSVAFDIPENRHKDGILATSTVPANVSPETMATAVGIAQQIAGKLDYVGVLAVELFVVEGRKLLVNEIAPRVHNSGHWTSDACLVSQFEQHIRAVCGWPLGVPGRHSDVTMTNLIGMEAETWPEIAAERGARLHLYGKAEIRPGRKMGHVNRVTPLRK